MGLRFVKDALQVFLKSTQVTCSRKVVAAYGDLYQNLMIGSLNCSSPQLVAMQIKSFLCGKARFNVATPTNVTVTCTAYVLPYNLQTKSI